MPVPLNMMANFVDHREAMVGVEQAYKIANENWLT